MIKVVLFGDRNDTSLTLPLCRCLERYGGVLYLGAGCIAEYSSQNSEFVLIETDCIENCNVENSIFILKSPELLSEMGFLPNEMNYIISEFNDNIRAVPAKNSLILCSTGSKGDILLSSLNQTSACISVQHCLKTLSGRQLDPCEFKVGMDTEIIGYPLLAICCVLILSEKNTGFFLNI